MSRENVEIVRRMYDAWNRDDFEVARPLIHPEVEWRTSGAFPGLEPVYRGVGGVRQFWQDLKEPWESFLIHIERDVAEGDTVIVNLRFEAIGRASGAKVVLHFANTWRVQDGLVVDFGSTRTFDEALEAAGLRE